jgi:hypothetical protein
MYVLDVGLAMEIALMEGGREEVSHTARFVAQATKRRHTHEQLAQGNHTTTTTSE